YQNLLSSFWAMRAQPCDL
ncbi:EPSP synthase family protein, partial [Vibrio parahaemolyticus V-223/04]